MLPESPINVKETLPDQQAYEIGEQAIRTIYDPLKASKLFPNGFDFTIARQLFETWLAQSEEQYSAREINALWVGFGHELCDLFRTKNQL